MTEAGWTVCIECGMMCEAVEYHPYAACLMFKQCLNSETVRANLQAVRDDNYQQGRVAGLREAEDYAERCVKERQLQLLNLGDQAALDPNDRRPGWIRCKASEARRIQVWCARQTQQAQAAQDEKGVGDGQQ